MGSITTAETVLALSAIQAVNTSCSTWSWRLASIVVRTSRPGVPGSLIVVPSGPSTVGSICTISGLPARMASYFCSIPYWPLPAALTKPRS